ncbi:MAG: hypothetical protein JO154_22590 [Chitinophaga sp.]|uniref:hypothetical protein n=1 Tax=Chitinophaga sp. TaxID=1869181 RepID=UPI0025BB7CDA|nr:hypothetical protein [Chitinophaga sp.]MBV8255406.1 hypothetical protein [Chitinophaga sp.]
MKLFIPKYLFLLLCISFSSSLMAQDDLEKATALMMRVKNAYDSANMSFQMKYTYAAADKPNIITDSLTGEIKMSGKDCLTSIGNVVLLKNKSYSISIFKEDKLMMLSRPSELTESVQLPTTAITAALKKTGVVSCSMKKVKQMTSIIFKYDENASCKTLEVMIDETALRIMSMKAQVKKPGDADAQAASDTYVIISSVFSGFKSEKVDPSTFDEHMFFTRTGNVFKPSPKYADYQVFLASPNF